MASSWWRGARIDSRLYDRLVQHKLRDPIDQHLVGRKCGQRGRAAQTARVLCAKATHTAAGQALGSAERVLAPLRYLPLTGPVAFQLTVMREQRPELFRHSLQMMLVALFWVSKWHGRGVTVCRWLPPPHCMTMGCSIWRRHGATRRTR